MGLGCVSKLETPAKLADIDKNQIKFKQPHKVIPSTVDLTETINYQSYMQRLTSPSKINQYAVNLFNNNYGNCELSSSMKSSPIRNNQQYVFMTPQKGYPVSAKCVTQYGQLKFDMGTELEMKSEDKFVTLVSVQQEKPKQIGEAEEQARPGSGFTQNEHERKLLPEEKDLEKGKNNIFVKNTDKNHNKPKQRVKKMKKMILASALDENLVKNDVKFDENQHVLSSKDCMKNSENLIKPIQKLDINIMANLRAKISTTRKAENIACKSSKLVMSKKISRAKISKIIQEKKKKFQQKIDLSQFELIDGSKFIDKVVDKKTNQRRRENVQRLQGDLLLQRAHVRQHRYDTVHSQKVFAGGVRQQIGRAHV